MTSPCTTCADTVTPCPCPAFLRWDAAANPEPEPAGPCLVCDEVAYQLLCGETLETIAPRILNRYGKPFRLDSLVRHLQRERRGDLLPPGAQRRVTA